MTDKAHKTTGEGKAQYGRILFFYPVSSTFIRTDIALLSRRYEVLAFGLNLPRKFYLPFRLLAQLVFLIRHGRSAGAFVCFFAGYSSLLPALIGKWLGKPCLIIVAGTDAASFPSIGYGNYARTLLSRATSASLRRASAILPVHESLVAQHYDYDESGWPAQGFSVFAHGTEKVPAYPVYFGYDGDLFRPAQGVNPEPGTFISVGDMSVPTLFLRKGFDLIAAFAAIRPDLKFTLVGWDGKSRVEVPSNVRLLPFMPQDELVRNLSAHEYYFQLSLMEGFPNALAEAMLCGCIPIGSSVSAIPYMIDNTGYVLKHRNVDELAALVERALADPRRKNLPQAARKRIARMFTLEKRSMGLFQAIELAMARSK